MTRKQIPDSLWFILGSAEYTLRGAAAHVARAAGGAGWRCAVHDKSTRLLGTSGWREAASLRTPVPTYWVAARTTNDGLATTVPGSVP